MLRLLAALAFVLSPVIAEAAEEFALHNEGPQFNGTWQIRVFTISSEGSDTWGEPHNGADRVEFVEAADGTLTGTMTMYGETFPITGAVDYGEDRVIVTWAGEYEHEGTRMRRTFHAYLLQLYSSADEQVDMLAGTEGVIAVGQSFGGSGSFVAVPAEF